MAYIIGIDHVQLALPPGGETLARQFYSGMLGLPELEKPASLAVRGGCWFDCGGGQQIHVGGETEFRPARKAHPALLVNDLITFLGELRERGLPADFDEPVPGAVRATIADPFGNRIELIERQAR